MAKPSKCKHLQYIPLFWGHLNKLALETLAIAKKSVQYGVGSTHLHQLHAAQALLGNASDQLVCLSWQQTARLGPSGAGNEGGVQGIDVIWSGLMDR